MGLVAGIPVFGGGGDLSMITVGAGCFNIHDTHIYIGTSGWVVSTVDRRMTDIDGMIASILGAIPGVTTISLSRKLPGALTVGA
jgi:xylulokinase